MMKLGTVTCGTPGKAMSVEEWTEWRRQEDQRMQAEADRLCTEFHKAVNEKFLHDLNGEPTH